MKKIAVISNINITPVTRLFGGEFEVYEAEGYGNELEVLMNKDSSLYRFQPEAVFLIEDTMEVIRHELAAGSARGHISDWFQAVSAAIDHERTYFISDAYLYGYETELPQIRKIKRSLECLWDDELDALVSRNPNVYVFPYRAVIEAIGEEKAFLRKTWYLGGILHSADAHKRICGEIQRQIRLSGYTPKKALVLDLDNTLWGGPCRRKRYIPCKPIR